EAAGADLSGADAAGDGLVPLVVAGDCARGTTVFRDLSGGGREERKRVRAGLEVVRRMAAGLARGGSAELCVATSGEGDVFGSRVGARRWDCRSGVSCVLGGHGHKRKSNLEQCPSGDRGGRRARAGDVVEYVGYRLAGTETTDCLDASGQ